MDLAPLIAKLIADTKQFEGPMRVAVQTTARFNKQGEMVGATAKVMAKQLDAAGKATSGFGLAMTQLSRAIKVTNTIVDTFAGGVKRAYDAASEGAKIMAATEFFKNAGKDIAEYRKATSGMVSDAELMKKANLADSMGINEETFKKLVMVAEASALKTGQSFDYMFNSIIVGTARSSRLLLDNLGIIVSVGQANEVYAAKIGKTVEALSAEEKQLAFVEEVARKSQGTLDEYAKVTDRTAESFARFDATVANLVDTIKVKLASAFASVLPEISAVLQQMQTFISRGDWTALGEDIGLRVLEGISGVVSQIDPLGLYSKLGGAFAAQRGLNKYTSDTRAQSEKSFYQQEALTAAQEIEKATSESLQSLAKRYQTLGSVGSSALDTLVADMIKFNKLADDILGLNNKNDLFGSTKTPTPPSGKGRSKSGPAEARDYTVPAEDKFMYGGDFKGGSLMASILASTKSMWDAAQVWIDGLEEGSGSFATLQAETQRLTLAQETAALSLQDLSFELQRTGLEAFEPLKAMFSGGGVFAPLLQVGDNLNKEIGGVAGALQGALSSVMGAAAGGPLGAIIGFIAPIIADTLDGLRPVKDILDQVGLLLKVFLFNAVGPLLQAFVPLFQALTPLLGAVGLVIGGLLDPFVSLITGIVVGLGYFLNALVIPLTLLGLLANLLFAVLDVFGGFGLSLEGMVMNLEWFSSTVVQAAVDLNNGFVKVIRGLGLKNFGRYLEAEDYTGVAQEDNTEAIKENTKALREFSREFRNLPQNYKVAATIAATQDPEAVVRRPPSNWMNIGSGNLGRNFATLRDRT